MATTRSHRSVNNSNNDPESPDTVPLSDYRNLQAQFETLRQEVRDLQSGFQSRSNTPGSAVDAASAMQEPKASAIDTFSQGADELDNFLTQLLVLFTLKPITYATDQVKVMTAIQHLRGNALDWAKPILLNEEAILQDYTLFTGELKAAFGDPHRKETAARKLRALRQLSSVSEYRSRFESLSRSVGWNDEAKASQFYAGLRPEIKAVISTVVERPTSYQGMRNLALSIDQNLQARQEEIFAERVQAAPSTPRPRTATVPVHTSNPTPGHFRAPLSDAEKQRRRESGLCLYCAQAGHISINCPNRRARPTFAHTASPTPPQSTVTDASSISPNSSVSQGVRVVAGED